MAGKSGDKPTSARAQPAQLMVPVSAMPMPEVTFNTFDRYDEDQIIAEMRGEMISSFVYEFQQDGKTVRGLSYVGVKEAARYLGRISTELVSPLNKVTDARGDLWMCVVRATDHARELSLLGTASQPVTFVKRNGQLKVDDFAPQKALSKAQRNAIRALISEELAQKVIAEFVSKGKVRQVQAQPDRAQENGTAQTSNPSGVTDAEWKILADLDRQLPKENQVAWGKLKLEVAEHGFGHGVQLLAFAHQKACTPYPCLHIAAYREYLPEAKAAGASPAATPGVPGRSSEPSAEDLNAVLPLDEDY